VAPAARVGKLEACIEPPLIPRARGGAEAPEAAAPTGAAVGRGAAAPPEGLTCELRFMRFAVSRDPLSTVAVVWLGQVPAGADACLSESESLRAVLSGQSAGKLAIPPKAPPGESGSISNARSPRAEA
jgi:hypothetical protein